MEIDSVERHLDWGWCARVLAGWSLADYSVGLDVLSADHMIAKLAERINAILRLLIKPAASQSDLSSA